MGCTVDCAMPVWCIDKDSGTVLLGLILAAGFTVFELRTRARL